jgi:hypothetical protein
MLSPIRSLLLLAKGKILRGLPLLGLGLGPSLRLWLGPMNSFDIFARPVYVSIVLRFVVFLFLFGLGRPGLVNDFNEIRTAGTLGFIQVYHEIVRLITDVAVNLFFAHTITIHYVLRLDVITY